MESTAEDNKRLYLNRIRKEAENLGKNGFEIHKNYILDAIKRADELEEKVIKIDRTENTIVPSEVAQDPRAALMEYNSSFGGILSKEY